MFQKSCGLNGFEIVSTEHKEAAKLAPARNAQKAKENSFVIEIFAKSEDSIQVSCTML